MAGSITKRPTDIEEENTGLVGRWRLLPKQCLVQEGVKGKEYEPKSPHIFHATKDKHQPIRTTELNKHRGSRNGVKARKKQNLDGVEHTERARHHLLVPSQYIEGGSWVKAFKGCGLVVGRKRGSILGFLLELLWEEMSCQNGISPKRGKYRLRPLDACHRFR